ncbi:MAG: GIY-YIG nuclease family protein [Patescibacteria group bacterium]
MFFVYILYSKKDHKLYVGCTINLIERITRHNNGHVKATCHRRPLECIYSEEFTSKADAFNRERFLKSLWAGRLKKKILTEYLNKQKTKQI